MLNGNIHLTPTEQKIFDLLSDGQGHRPEEIIKYLDSEADVEDNSYYVALRTRICHLRAKLKTSGEDIVAQAVGKRVFYRRIRQLIIRQD